MDYRADASARLITRHGRSIEDLTQMCHALQQSRVNYRHMSTGLLALLLGVGFPIPARPLPQADDSVGHSREQPTRSHQVRPSASASPDVGWHEPPMVPLPASVRSLEVRQFDTPIWLEPAGTRRRGSLLAGTKLPIVGSRRPSGDCLGRWFLVGPSAWVCGDHLRYGNQPPTPDRAVKLSALPYRYYSVGNNGAFGYSALSLVGEGVPDSQLAPGFIVAVVNEKVLGDERVVYTTNDLWIPLADLVPIRSPSFAGVRSSEVELVKVAWLTAGGRFAHELPFKKRTRKFERLQRVIVEETQRVQGVEWLRTEQGDWVRASDVRRPSSVLPPQDLRPDERWIDVDTRTQILTAYEGTTPVFVTLVSTGKGPVGSATRTPLGEHRIWVKLASTDMTNLEDTTASRHYAIEAVPWVQFFKGGYGLHAAFWHESFGAPRSHGCVNLSPPDAAFLFEWTNPRLPSGWHAVHPLPEEPSTRVRVR